MTTRSDAAATPPALADRLWATFRPAVERILARRPRPWGEACHDDVRGAAYLVLADLVTVLVDRVEQADDPARHEAFASVLDKPDEPGSGPASERRDP